MVYIIGGKDHQILNGRAIAEGLEKKLSLVRKTLPDFFRNNLIIYYVSVNDTGSNILKTNLNPYGVNVISLYHPDLEKLLIGINRSELSDKGAGLLINPGGFKKEDFKRLKEFIPIELDLNCDNPAQYQNQSPFFYPIASEAGIRILTENKINVRGKSVGIIGKNKTSLGLQQLLPKYQPNEIISLLNQPLTMSEMDILFLTNGTSIKSNEIQKGSTIVNVSYTPFSESKQIPDIFLFDKAKYIADVQKLIWGVLAEHAYKAYIYKTIKNTPEKMFLRLRQSLIDGITSLIEDARGRGVPKKVSKRYEKWEEWKKKNRKKGQKGLSQIQKMKQ